MGEALETIVVIAVNGGAWLCVYVGIQLMRSAWEDFRAWRRGIWKG